MISRAPLLWDIRERAMKSKIKTPPEQRTSVAPQKRESDTEETGVNVVETHEAEVVPTREESEEVAEGEELVEVQQQSVSAKSKPKELAERINDPVRMYLREMGSVELLSREGEIAIAKRIEAGREIVIAGLCESPLTFQAIIIWRDELNEGKVLLRDIIDLDATYGGPDAKAMPMVRSDDQLTVGIAAPNQAGRPPPLQAPTIAPVFATPLKPAGEHSDGREMATERMTGESNLDDEEMENWLSVAAIEAELKPKVVKSFDAIAGTYKRLRRLQDQDIQSQLKHQSLSPAQERKYNKLKNEIIGEVKSLRLNRARIDALVEQLHDINKRLVSHEGRLMRLAEGHGVVRDDFLKNYLGSELDPLWLNRVSKFSANGWKKFVAKDQDKIKQHRQDIHALAGETGLEIGEFRKIVQIVQNGEREARQAKKEMVEANLRLVIDADTSLRPMRPGGSGRQSPARSPTSRAPSACLFT
jgi:RNA polymerase primary sigma factor